MIGELVDNKETANEGLADLPLIFKDKEGYSKVLINKLCGIKRYDVAGRIMKKLKIPKEQYPLVPSELLCIAAKMMPKWERNFSWETLEEVYFDNPKAIARCINYFEFSKEN